MRFQETLRCEDGATSAAGRDVDSVFGDPLFVDSMNANLRLRPGSPALGIGFREVDWSLAGPRREHTSSA